MAKDKSKYLTYQDKEFERNQILEEQRKKELKEQANVVFLALQKQKRIYQLAKKDYKTNLRHIKSKLTTVQQKAYLKQSKMILKKMRFDYKKAVFEYELNYERGSYKIKRWYYGLQKEVKRTSWASAKSVITSLFVVIIIVVLLAAIFFGIDSAFIKLSAK
ncbi:hypothetical protein JM47_03220 [Ureaplasma diversum]|uniref:Preprotein translocase, SecE subunit family n=2 Tax=Ureaplasma diversum TaxID=42094 RepID=A0A084EWR0_9BACT|nr:preprotein translocase subunit SecE [Ureaplasma diversum]AJQ45549.1 hypothetical protein JM47_03220 [Ureaplasma diversum]KEZ22402.1 Preprotein translocase, SecE subunit family [Ureaplasma diversum NCTC 246]